MNIEDCKAKVEAMTMEQRRARIVEIDELTSKGDYSWSYDEYMILRQNIPEELVALNKVMSDHKKRVARKR